MQKIFIQSPNIMRKVAIGTIWICESSRTNCVFHILREVGAERKIVQLRSTYLLLQGHHCLDRSTSLVD